MAGSDFDTFNPYSAPAIATGGSAPGDFDTFAKPYVPPAPAPVVDAGGGPAPFGSFSGSIYDVIAHLESRGHSYAPGGGLVTSPKGAQGMMQVMPSTNHDPGFGVRPAQDGSEAERIRVGRDYADAMLQRYHGNPALALAAYNAGPGRVDDALKQGDDWFAHLPAETRKYVNSGMALAGGQKFPEPPPTQRLDATGGFSSPEVAETGGFQHSGNPETGGFKPTAPKANDDQGGFFSNTGAVSGFQSGVASAIKAFGSAVDFMSADPEAFAAAQGGGVMVPPTGPGKRNDVASKTFAPVVTGMEERAAANAPKNPNLAQRVVGGAAGMVPAMAAGAANPLAMAGIFAQQSYDETYHEAIAAGLSPDEAVTAASQAAAISGTLGMVPGEAVVGKIGGAIAKKLGIRGAQSVVGQVVQRGVTRAAGNAAVMGGMKASSNVVAKANYDPDRPVLEGVGEAALEGALAGEVIHGATRASGKIVDTAADVVKRARAGNAEVPAGEPGSVETMPATDALQNYRAGMETPAGETPTREAVKPTFEVGDAVRAGETRGAITEISKSGKSAKVEGIDKWVPLKNISHDEYVDPATGRPVVLHGAEDAALPGEIAKEPAPAAEPVPDAMAHEAAQPFVLRRPTPEPTAEHEIAPLSEEAQATHEELTKRLVDTGLDQNVALRIVDTLDGPQGSYHEGVIKVALDHPDTLDTMNHEVLHAVRDAITPKEWDALTSEAGADPMLMASIKRRYPTESNDPNVRTYTPEEQMEEAVADLMKWYAKGVREYPKGAIAAAFDRIRDIFAQLGNALRGRGFHTSESVLRAIDTGKIGGRMTDDRYTASPLLQAAYHGSPHDFDQFSDHAIGSGEGVQAFGHGHYFAGKKEVAQYYRNVLSRDQKIGFTVDGKRQSLPTYAHDRIAEKLGLPSRTHNPQAGYVAQYILGEMVRGKSLSEAIKTAREDYAHYDKEDVDKAVAAVRAADPKIESPTGKLYKVEIPEEHEYLDYDKPMSAQSPYVKRALEEAGFLHTDAQIAAMKADLAKMSRERVTGSVSEETYWDLVGRIDEAEGTRDISGRSFYDHLATQLRENFGDGDQAASTALREVGIAGNRYKDALSRGTEDGTSNYVVFDPKRIEVKEKFSKPEDTKRLRDQAREMGINPDSIPALRELEELNKFHASFGEKVKARTEAMRQLYNEVIPKLREAGKLPFEVGTRFTTPKSRELGQPPWKVTGYYLDPKDLQKYGYRVERGSREHDDFESSQMLVSDPKGDASPYRDKDWDRAAHVAQWQPLGGLSAVKFSLPDVIHDIAPHMDHPEVYETPDKELYVRTPPGYVHDTKMVEALADFGARPTNTYPRKGDRVLTKEEVNALQRGGGHQGRDTAPLEGAPTPEGATGPDAGLNSAAHEYARSIGLDHKRQAEYATVDPERAARIAAAYDAMEHNPHDPVVHEAYQNLIRQTEAQYRSLEKAGYKFWLFDESNDPYAGNPMNAMRDLRANKSMGVFATEAGFGSKATDLDVSENPLLADTGIKWPYGSPDGPLKRVTANDLFRAVHDAFGHGIEGANFRARGEENAWQAHARLYTGSALGALTSETRGQNSWLNYGPHGEANRTAKTEDTVFADQKTGLMPEWTWREGRVGDMETTHGPRETAAEHAGERGGVRQVGGQGGDEGTSRTPHEAPPTDAQGEVALQHWTAEPGVTRTDPAQWGRSGKFLPIEERSRKGVAPGRTYFGIASGEPGGYVIEKFPGAAREKVEGRLPLDRLYDMAGDPDGLRAKAADLPKRGDRYLYNGKWQDGTSLYENLIKDAGYKGYWIKDGNLGLTAAVYEPVDVSKPKFSLPDDDKPSLTPAIRFKGKVYKSVGDHLSAISQIPDAQSREAAMRDGENRGYVTERGKYLNRFRAQEYAVAHGLIRDDAPAWAKTTPELISENLKKPRYSIPDEGERRRAEGPVGRVMNRILGKGVDAVGAKLTKAADKYMPDPVNDLMHEVKMGTNPMNAGSPRAQAEAKDFANAQRLAAYQWGKVGEWLRKTFDPDQRRKMWEAADEHGVLLRRGQTPGAGEGLNRLTENERAAVEELQRRADQSFEVAKALGMVTGEGLESYVPRMIVEMSATGPARVRAKATPEQARKGGNLSTTTGQLRQRKHETVEDTEAAAKAAFGDNTEVVRDIGTLALATQRLDQAIAGRTLVEKIKAVGKETGQELVQAGVTDKSEDFFTIPDHPALQTWRPKLIKNEYGKWEAMKDQNGDPVMEANPLYISKEFEGPLKAVLSTPTSGLVRALMNLKGKMMSVIMYNPMMHNAVIWGKAIPADPAGVLLLYRYVAGNRARKDEATMNEAITAGMDPIGGRYFNQDIVGIAAAEGNSLHAGNSWTAQLLSAIPGLFKKEAGEAVRNAVDKAGDVWHNTFLWDRVGDLQAGLYVHIRDKLIKGGSDPVTAQRTAAHFANRYGGALPMEAMSKAARNIANLLLFSRSFTLGNIGVFKDIMVGLPSDVRAQILRDGGVQQLEKAQGIGRRKAIAMLALDVILAHIGLYLAARAVSWMTGNPFQAPEDNEHGKEDRFLIRYEDDGTAIYGRLPTGKVAEDQINWVKEPREELLRKLSPFAKLGYSVAANDRGFGHKMFDESDDSIQSYAKNVGNIFWALGSGMLPMGQLQAGSDFITGQTNDPKTSALAAFLPLTGITINRGAPGGPAMAQMYAVKEHAQFLLDEAKPEITRMIKTGDLEGARAKMTEINVAPSLQAYIIRSTLNPQLKMSPKQIRAFMQSATPEQKADFQQDRDAMAARRSGQ